MDFATNMISCVKIDTRVSLPRYLSSLACSLSVLVLSALLSRASTSAQTAIETAPATAPVTALAHYQDSRQIYIGSQDGIARLDLPSLAIHSKLKTQLLQVHDLALSPDARWLLAAGGKPGEAGQVELWSLTDDKLARSIEAHRDLVYRVDWSPRGDHFVTASADGSCRVYRLGDPAPAAEFRGHSKPVLSILFLDPTKVVSTSIDQSLRVWNPSDGLAVAVLDNHVGPVLNARLQPKLPLKVGEARTTATIASCSEDKTVRLWQPSTGRMLRFAKLKAIAQTLCWSLDGSMIWAGCRDGVVRGIDPETALVVRELASCRGWIYELIAVDPEHLVVGGEDGCRLVRTQ